MAVTRSSGIRDQLTQVRQVVAPLFLWSTVAAGLWVLVTYARSLLEGL